MKFLCICAGGNVRSRAMAWALMELHRQEALSVGAQYNRPETIAMLCEWADRIVVMEPSFVTAVPVQLRTKVAVCDVGEDLYGSPWHFILQDKVKKFATDWSRRGFAV